MERAGLRRTTRSLDTCFSSGKVKRLRVLVSRGKERKEGIRWWIRMVRRALSLSLFPLPQVSFAGSILATEFFASSFFDRFFRLFVRFLLARFDVDPMQMQRLDCGRSKISTLRVWINRAPNESLYLTKKRKRDAAARFPWIADKNNSSFNR